MKKLHRDHKEWENAARARFIDGEVKAYNRRYAEISRLHTSISALEATYAELRKSIRLPRFSFSLQTLEQYHGGKYLQYLERDSAGKYPRQVAVGQLFSLERQSALPAPDFAEFNRLVNLEFRLRMRMQIKYEVLLRVKSHLARKNSQWSSRDSALNQFLTRDLAKMMGEVDKIKTSEYEDLKYYDDYDMDSPEDEVEASVEPDAEAEVDGREETQEPETFEAGDTAEADQEAMEEAGGEAIEEAGRETMEEAGGETVSQAEEQTTQEAVEDTGAVVADEQTAPANATPVDQTEESLGLDAPAGEDMLLD